MSIYERLLEIGPLLIYVAGFMAALCILLYGVIAFYDFRDWLVRRRVAKLCGWRKGWDFTHGRVTRIR